MPGLYKDTTFGAVPIGFKFTDGGVEFEKTDAYGGFNKDIGYRNVGDDREVVIDISKDSWTPKWPMLEPIHLQAIMFAYNEGYSKALDGRVFKNPFSEFGSQAAAWELGTEDGNRHRRDMEMN